MNEQFLEELRAALTSLNERIAKLEYTVNEVWMKSFEDAYHADARDQAILALKEKYAVLEELIPQLKLIQGDDYDVYADLYDNIEANRSNEGFDEDTYANEQIEGLRGRLNALREVPVQEQATVQENELPAEEAKLMEEYKQYKEGV